jgi:MbtH protein
MHRTRRPGTLGSEPSVVARATTRADCRLDRAKGNEVAVTNPFEDTDALYLVLVNDEGQYSLWPAGIAVPDGWVRAHDADSRSNCLEYVEEQWSDMRPNSLVQAERA